MNLKIKEVLKGILYGVVTMIFMIGALPWDLVSKIIGCIIAMLAIRRIKKLTAEGKSVASFTVSYIAVIILTTLFLTPLLTVTP